MKQKYLILKGNGKDRLTIKEFAETGEGGAFSLLCKETFDSKAIEPAIAMGKKALASILRTQNMYPPTLYMEEITKAVIDLYFSEDDQQVELLFSAIKPATKDYEKPKVVIAIKNESIEDDELLEDDLDENDVDKGEFSNITSPIKIADVDDRSPDTEEEDPVSPNGF